MTDPHPIGVRAADPKTLEGVGPGFVREGLLDARTRTIAACEEIRAAIREGMTEGEARKLALGIFADRGAKKHWHQPYIRFGAGTVLTFNDPLQPDYHLREGDPFYIDLGPVWADENSGIQYEGDYGDTFVLGSNPEAERCAQATRALFQETRTRWRERQETGQAIYAFMKTRAEALGFVLADAANGHRLSDFPHHRYTKESIAHLPFVPSDSLWVLETQLVDPARRFGAFFEDLLDLKTP